MKFQGSLAPVGRSEYSSQPSGISRLKLNDTGLYILAENLGAEKFLVFLSKLVPLLVLLSLSACNGIALYYSVPAGSSYDFEDVKKASASGGVYTEVIGSPPGTIRVNIPKFVRHLMSGDFHGYPIRFVGKSPGAKAPEFRVVVVFNPSLDRRQPTNLCTYQGGVAVNPDPRRAEVFMALCSGTTELSSASGVFFFLNVDPVEQNRFRNLIKSATNALLPIRVYEEDREFERWF